MSRAEEEAVAAFSDWDARDARQLAEDRARLADATDARFTDAQRQQLEAFEGADEPAEVAEARVVERVARAIYAIAGEACEGYPWEEASEEIRNEVRTWAAAAVAAMPVSPADAAVRRVEALADCYYAAAEGAPQPAASARRLAANRIRAALAPQAGEAGQCGSRGPRIGSEGTPICRQLQGHTGPHQPAADDGWGAVTWNDFS